MKSNHEKDLKFLNNQINQLINENENKNEIIDQLNNKIENFHIQDDEK